MLGKKSEQDTLELGGQKDFLKERNLCTNEYGFETYVGGNQSTFWGKTVPEKGKNEFKTLGTGVNLTCEGPKN